MGKEVFNKIHHDHGHDTSPEETRNRSQHNKGYV
jgi:hypothetical protein